jgi:hypothetical protein
MAVFLDDSVPNQRFDTVIIERIDAASGVDISLTMASMIQLLLNVCSESTYVVNDTSAIQTGVDISNKRYIGNSKWWHN